METVLKMPASSNLTRGRLRSYLAKNPILAARFDKIRKYAYPIISSNYDITRECNLKCEGCLFFEGTDYQPHLDDKNERQWDQFFTKEARRGVNFPYFVGAEPALVENRLRLAARHFERGITFTNGTRKIDSALPFTIHVSLWGDRTSTKKFRGGSVFDKAINNYIDDPRAVFIYTLNHQNLAYVEEIAQICATNGLKLSFNHFSATEVYQHKLKTGKSTDKHYFRISSAQDNLRLDHNDLQTSNEIIRRLMLEYPDTIIYSSHYNDWISQPEGIFNIDPNTGLAKDCRFIGSNYHRHYYTDLMQSKQKCCAPNIDCADCRAYAMANAAYRHRFRDSLTSFENFAQWIDVVEVWCRLFITGWDQLKVQTPQNVRKHKAEAI